MRATGKTTQASTGDQDQPGTCEFRLKGHLDRQWADWFGGLTITLEGNGDARLTGVADQAALHGLLSRVRDLGMPLLAVTCVQPDCSDGADAG